MAERIEVTVAGGKMDPQVKAAWLAAARSGEFSQGRQCLKSGENYCILGVLCELHRRAFGGQWIGSPANPLDMLPAAESYHGEDASLPRRVAEWAGLSEVDVRWERYDVLPVEGFLAGRLNDRLKWTFDEICDWIEANL